MSAFCSPTVQMLTLETCVVLGDKVETFPVLKIDSKDIVDTNGAGDAFVGGKFNIRLNITGFLWVFFIFSADFYISVSFATQVSCLSWSRRNLWSSA